MYYFFTSTFNFLRSDSRWKAHLDLIDFNIRSQYKLVPIGADLDVELITDAMELLKMDHPAVRFM